jgi:hypothetical protein
MKPLEYLHLQLRLEGKAVVEERWIRRVVVVPGEELPLILVAQLSNEIQVAYVNESLPAELQNEIMQCPAKFTNLGPWLDILRRNQIRFEVGHYKTYIFPPTFTTSSEVHCLSRDDPGVKAFGFDGLADEVYAVERKDKIVSACVSTRENKACGEAWVFTDPAYRNQGFAGKVVFAWARSLMAAGKVPFYSHEIQNIASANLARKLGLLPVFEEISVNPISVKK